MNGKILKTTAVALAGCLVFAAAAGCKSQTAAGTKTSAGSTSYPISTTKTLTYWVALNGNVASNYKSLGDTPYAKELEKETGVKIEYKHPASGQATTEFNLMVSSGNLPDMIEYNWLGFPGGPQAAINNNVIVKLNKYYTADAPDLTKLLKSKPDIDKQIKTDEGSYYVFPNLNTVNASMATYGMVVRGDWLKELNLKVPETIDDWHAVLTAFKTQKGATLPLTYDGSSSTFRPFENGYFTGAYGINKGFYVDNGKVKFGPYEKGYKDWLTTMNQWYKEGLIDNNFATNDSKAKDADVLGGKTGAVPVYPGSDLGKYLPALKAKDANATLVPTPVPVLKKGEKPQFGYMLNNFLAGTGVAITTSCKDPDLAAKFLNFGYSDKGSLLYNFGVPGVSYNMVNGTPKVTDEVLKNPKGLSIGAAWASYARGVYPGPYDGGKYSKEYMDQYYPYQEQKDAIPMWSNTDMAKHIMPPVTPTQDESTQLSKYNTDITTFVNEYTLKAIMGVQSLNDYDNSFTAKLKSLNVEKVIAIEQASYDRYNKR